MKVIAISEFGRTENFFEVERDTPRPRADEVLIRIRAGSFNPIDYKIRQGRYGGDLPMHRRLARVNRHQALRGTDCFRLCWRCGIVTLGNDQGRGNETGSNDDWTPRRGLSWARLGG
jgi:hypothetical protein